MADLEIVVGGEPVEPVEPVEVPVRSGGNRRVFAVLVVLLVVAGVVAFVFTGRPVPGPEATPVTTLPPPFPTTTVPVGELPPPVLDVRPVWFPGEGSFTAVVSAAAEGPPWMAFATGVGTTVWGSPDGVSWSPDVGAGVLAAGRVWAAAPVGAGVLAAGEMDGRPVVWRWGPETGWRPGVVLDDRIGVVTAVAVDGDTVVAVGRTGATAPPGSGSIFMGNAAAWWSGDGGMTWSVATLDAPAPSSVNDVGRLSSGAFVAVGGAAGSGVVWTSVDGGRTWTPDEVGNGPAGLFTTVLVDGATAEAWLTGSGSRFGGMWRRDTTGVWSPSGYSASPGDRVAAFDQSRDGHSRRALAVFGPRTTPGVSPQVSVAWQGGKWANVGVPDPCQGTPLCRSTVGLVSGLWTTRYGPALFGSSFGQPVLWMPARVTVDVRLPTKPNGWKVVSRGDTQIMYSGPDLVVGVDFPSGQSYGVVGGRRFEIAAVGSPVFPRQIVRYVSGWALTGRDKSGTFAVMVSSDGVTWRRIVESSRDIVLAVRPNGRLVVAGDSLNGLGAPTATVTLIDVAWQTHSLSGTVAALDDAAYVADGVEAFMVDSDGSRHPVALPGTDTTTFGIVRVGERIAIAFGGPEGVLEPIRLAILEPSGMLTASDLPGQGFIQEMWGGVALFDSGVRSVGPTSVRQRVPVLWWTRDLVTWEAMPMDLFHGMTGLRGTPVPGVTVPTLRSVDRGQFVMWEWTGPPATTWTAPSG